MVVTVSRWPKRGDELIAAKKLLNAGQSPAAAKRDGIKRIRGAETFTVHTDAYMKHVVWLTVRGL